MGQHCIRQHVLHEVQERLETITKGVTQGGRTADLDRYLTDRFRVEEGR